MAEVLVSGGSGFIGWHVAQALLARGDRVTCLVRKRSQVGRLQALGVRLVYGDILEPESLRHAVAGSQIVYHVAGCIAALHAAEYYRINAEGVHNVAQACAAQPSPPVLVWVSSLAAAGPAIDGRPRTEDDPPVQLSHYGRSKRAARIGGGEVRRPRSDHHRASADGCLARPIGQGSPWSSRSHNWASTCFLALHATKSP